MYNFTNIQYTDFRSFQKCRFLTTRMFTNSEFNSKMMHKFRSNEPTEGRADIPKSNKKQIKNNHPYIAPTCDVFRH